MKRYLLFDSGCHSCSELAQTIEREAEGWLTARSLRDAEMQSLLKKADPNYRWEPALLEVKGEKIHLATGLNLMAKIVTGLGIKKAWRISKLVRQAPSPKHLKHAHRNRRRFLRRIGALITTMPLLMGPRKLNLSQEGLTRPEANADRAQEVDQQAEVWNGFALLPTWDAPLPELVQQAPMPIMGKARGPRVNEFRPDKQQFDSVEELIQDLPHPIAYPAEFPWPLELTIAETTRFSGSGAVHNVMLQFEALDQAKLVRLTVRFIYPRPYPIRPLPSPVLRMEKIIYPEKVSFTPSPGIGLFTETSEHLFWIDERALYFLHTEPDVSREQLQATVNSLVKN